MIESQWRTKLVQQFKTHRPEGFIWAMDAKFKSGFPDLYVVDHDGAKHFELKVCSKCTGISIATLRSYFKPVQVSVMKSIQKAGGYAIGMVLNLGTGNVYLFDPTQDIMFILSPERFKKWWTTSSHSWMAAELS